MTGATIDGNTKVFRCYFDAGQDAVKATATPDVVCAESYIAQTTAGIITGSAPPGAMRPVSLTSTQ